MAFMAVLESDLRALSAEARRRYPAVKDAAEHAILKLRTLSKPSDIAQNEDVLRIFLMACEVKTVKLSVIGLSCLQKLISHDAVAQSALKEILATLKDHSEMADDNVQLKTLQTILIIFQSNLLPKNEDDMCQSLGIILRLLENNRSPDSVRNTAAATFRQASALVFDHVIHAESLPAGKSGLGSHVSRTNSVSGDVNRSIHNSVSLDSNIISSLQPASQESLTGEGRLGLQLLEDLTALAAGGSGLWLRVNSVQRGFALDILEFILSNYVAVFRFLIPYEQVLRHQICSLLMTSLRTNVEFEGEAGEPYFRRLVLRSVAHVVRLYSSSLITECEGFCVEARTLRLLFQNFDMNPKNTNVVEGMVRALARVVSSIQVPETSEESLAAVAGMFNSKAKGVEWSLENDASNAAVVVASEAHAITLAVEGLLGVVFTVATLTDEAVDIGELESPRCESDPPIKWMGQTANLSMAMVDSLWLIILDALSLILMRCILLTDSYSSVLLSPGSRRLEHISDQRDSIVLTTKNVQALRTLFNIAHRLHNVLGPSWILVLETLAALDRAIHSPHATTQEVPTVVSRLTRDSSSQYTDFNILSSLNSQLFESSAMMHISAVKSLLSALRNLSNQHCVGRTHASGQTSVSPQTSGTNAFVGSAQQIGSITFSVERMIAILKSNLHRVEPLWDLVSGHLLELAENPNMQIRNIALDALDQSVCAVLGSDQFHELTLSMQPLEINQIEVADKESQSFEWAIISPLKVLYSSTQIHDVRIGATKTLLHVLERHGEKLHHSWQGILEMLRSIVDSSEKDLIPLGFQCVRVIMNDGLSTIPPPCLHMCIEVTGAYVAQKTEINISLTAIGLLWTATDFIAKVLWGTKEGLSHLQLGGDKFDEESHTEHFANDVQGKDEHPITRTRDVYEQSLPMVDKGHCDKLLFLVFSILQKLGTDERPEVRNSAIRTLFQTLSSHGQKLSRSMWEDCLWNYVFPILNSVACLAASSSRDEWQGKELGTRGGKAKQWDETIVLVLGGITRILRSFFPFLLTLDNFWNGWESVLLFVRNCISNGSKEVAVAAINCLQTTALCHGSKGSLPGAYMKSIFDVYELILQHSPNSRDAVVIKVKQEILHSLGDFYDQANLMFDDAMYSRLLGILHLAVKYSKSARVDEEADPGISPIQRTILEMLPLLKPGPHLSTMWSLLFQQLFCYLPGFKPLPLEVDDCNVQKENPKHETEDYSKHSSSSGTNIPDDPRNLPDGKLTSPKHENSSGGCIALQSKSEVQSPHYGSSTGKLTMLSISSKFAEKLLPVLVGLFLHAPKAEKLHILPEMIQGLGRCMITRRDHPDGTIWRQAVEGMNRVITDDVDTLQDDQKSDPEMSRPTRTRFWKEVADVYELFLVGSCGRAFPSGVCSSTALIADEKLEMAVLDVLSDKILKSNVDAPPEILQRLVSTLDRCASRTASLPLESVGLLPLHCSKFSLACLQKIFSACSYEQGDEWSSSRFEVSKVSAMIIIGRCEFILERFLIDENDLGELPLPSVRIQEVLFVLKELAHLVLHPNTAALLPLQQPAKEAFLKRNAAYSRSHLLILFPSLCNIVITREARVRELVQVLLRLIAIELGLQKGSVVD
ncbi:MON2-like protein [Nymphaea thermarum]|nr:MON2-like protein [Nymphaea thermarum]